MNESVNGTTISAIITTCNRPVSILERAVRSVVSQTRIPDELIIIDDSSDESNNHQEMAEMLSRYAGKIDLRYIKNACCKGACYSRNKGIQTANGDYIAFLDDDDEWTKDKLRLQEKVALKKKNAVLITGYIRVVNDEDGKTRIYNRGWEYEGSVLTKILGNNFVGGCSAPLLKRSAVLQCGCFDEGFASSQDYDLWIRLAEAGDFAFVRDVIVDYHMHPGNITDDFDRRIKGWKRIYRKYNRSFKRYPEAKCCFLDMLAVNAWECKRVAFAFGMLGKSIRTCGFDRELLRTLIKMCRISLKHAVGRISTRCRDTIG